MAKALNNMTNQDHATKIFSEHGDYIKTIIQFKVSDKTLAEDLFQDFFLKLITHPIPENIKNIRSYLYRSIINDIIDASRRTKRYQLKLKNYTDVIKSNDDRRKTNVTELEREDLEMTFQALTKQLSKSEAQAITLRYMNNYNTQETAEKMGVKSRSISRYVSNGLNKLRKTMAYQGEDE